MRPAPSEYDNRVLRTCQKNWRDLLRACSRFRSIGCCLQIFALSHESDSQVQMRSGAGGGEKRVTGSACRPPAVERCAHANHAAVTNPSNSGMIQVAMLKSWNSVWHGRQAFQPQMKILFRPCESDRRGAARCRRIWLWCAQVEHVFAIVAADGLPLRPTMESLPRPPRFNGPRAAGSCACRRGAD